MSKKYKMIARPPASEYPAYAEIYMKRVTDDGLVLQELDDQIKRTRKFAEGLTEEQLLSRYAPGKWTIKEVLVHVIDDERIYAYRALRVGRGDRSALPGFNQDEYALNSHANERSLSSILKEYKSVRKATLSLFANFSDADLLRKGTANGYLVSARALLYHLAGHELHHLAVIRERYLGEKGE